MDMDKHLLNQKKINDAIEQRRQQRISIAYVCWGEREREEQLNVEHSSIVTVVIILKYRVCKVCWSFSLVVAMEGKPFRSYASECCERTRRTAYSVEKSMRGHICTSHSRTITIDDSDDPSIQRDQNCSSSRACVFVIFRLEFANETNERTNFGLKFGQTEMDQSEGK